MTLLTTTVLTYLSLEGTNKQYIDTELPNYYLVLLGLKFPFGCHIDAAEQQRALNFELVVSDQLFSVIFV